MRGQCLLFNCRWYSVLILFCLTPSLSAQIITVTDENDVPLIGVEVYNDDLSLGDVTNHQGQVVLTDINISSQVHFKYLGYKEYTITIQGLKAQKNIVKLQVNNQIIEDVIVLGRKTVSQSEIPFQIKTIDLKGIKATNAQTSADALSQHGGVYVQKSQMGGGSPVIRGFEANRVLLVVDHIRLNNAIYRSGHLQNAISVDQAMLERMEVIFGPNSLMYGSDALGGVVSFITRSPSLSLSKKPLSETNYYLRYASANDEKSAHIDFSYGREKWGSITSITRSKYGDLRSGSNRDARFPDFGKRLEYQGVSPDGSDIAIVNEDPNVQIGTAYDQIDILQKFLFTPTTDHRIVFNLQYSKSSDVPRYDNLSELRNGQLRWADWHYGPQQRLLLALDYRHLESTSLYDQLILIGSHQRISEDRITRRFGQIMALSQEEDVSVYSLTLDFSKYLDQQKKWSFDYGADIQHNNVDSKATGRNTQTGQEDANVLTRYASDANRLSNLGAYIYFKGKLKDGALNLTSGLRYSKSSYFLKYDRNDPIDWPSSFYDGINGSNNALTWSVGSAWTLNKRWQIRSMISTAFRSPNIDDLSKIRVNAQEITFPTLSLEAERSSNVELSIAYTKGEIFNISMTAFYTRLSDAIVRKPTLTPDGQDFWITQGDTLAVVGNKNVQNGEIKGLSVNLSGEINSSVNWYGSVNVTSGKEISASGEHLPLTHIPPIYGKIGIDYHHGPWGLKTVYRYNSSKALEDFGGSADNPDLATPIGALAWSTINLYATYKLTDQLDLSISGENLLDKHYRTFASGVSAPGINFVVSLRGGF